MVALATPADVAVPLGRPITTPAEIDQVQWWLDGVERLIVNRLGPVAALDAATVKYVEAETVAAKVRRSGTSESSITVAVDDGSVTRRYEGSTLNGGDISDEFWALLSGRTYRRGGAKMGWLL